MFWLNLAMFLLWQTQVVEIQERQYPDPSQLGVLLPPPCPPEACPPGFYAPMPVGMPMPAPMKAYRVEVRFTSCPKNELPPVKTCALVREKMPAAVSSVAWHADKQMHQATVSTAIKEVRGDKVDLDLNVVCAGAKPCCCQCVETVPLNMKRDLVLKGDGPEPYCAEVTVTEVTELPAPLCVATGSTGLPCPTSPITQCAATVPACCPPGGCPTPACCPPSVCPASMALQMPPNYPVAQPIPCMPPPTPVQLCTVTTPGRPMRTSHLAIVRDGDKARVKMTCGDSGVTSARMTVEGGEAGSLTVSCGAKCVHVTGKSWKAQAESIDVREDGTVTLRGHVRLTADRLGSSVSVKADVLCVKLTRGAFERIVHDGNPQQAIYAKPVSYPAPMGVPASHR
ncbi:MAG: hypothetical protein U0797_21010 [Gemmataceae bacterium]